MVSVNKTRPFDKKIAPTHHLKVIEKQKPYRAYTLLLVAPTDPNKYDIAKQIIKKEVEGAYNFPLPTIEILQVNEKYIFSKIPITNLIVSDKRVWEEYYDSVETIKHLEASYAIGVYKYFESLSKKKRKQIFDDEKYGDWRIIKTLTNGQQEYYSPPSIFDHYRYGRAQLESNVNSEEDIKSLFNADLITHGKWNALIYFNAFEIEQGTAKKWDNRQYEYASYRFEDATQLIGLIEGNPKVKDYKLERPHKYEF